MLNKDFLEEFKEFKKEVIKTLKSIERKVESIERKVESIEENVALLKKEIEISQLKVNALFFEVAKLPRPAGSGAKPDFGKYVLSSLRGINSTRTERKRGPFYW